MLQTENITQLHKSLLHAMGEDVECTDLSDRVERAFRQKLSHVGAFEKERLRLEMLGPGPLATLLDDTSITEIIVNAFDQIWIEKNGVLTQHKDQFISSQSYEAFLHRIYRESNIKPDLDRPFADGVWRGFRMHVILPPLTSGSPNLSLRRQAHNQWTLQRLEEGQWCNTEGISYMQKLINEKRSLLIVGATGTGKTSVLNALLNHVGPNERIVAIEDTNEIFLPNTASAKLLTRVHASDVLKDYDLGDLLKQSLRMRPDRIVIGEVRGPEAKDLLMALATGHDGGLGTLHADGARQALLRLEMLIQLGAPQWSLQAIRHLILLSVNYVVVVKKQNGVRKLDSISKVSSVEDTGFCLEKVYG